MNEKEITKKYEALLKSVAEDDFYDIDLTDRVNVYVCPKGHMTKTKEVDAGVTPFIMGCSKCQTGAQSRMYKGVPEELEVTREWYRPSLEETLRIAKQVPQALDHILQGGLLNRKITE